MTQVTSRGTIFRVSARPRMRSHFFVLSFWPVGGSVVEFTDHVNPILFKEDIKKHCCGPHKITLEVWMAKSSAYSI